MYVVGTLFRGEFWTIFSKADSLRKANLFARICQSARGEYTRVMSQDEWDKSSAARERERQEIAKKKLNRLGIAA